MRATRTLLGALLVGLVTACGSTAPTPVAGSTTDQSGINPVSPVQETSGAASGQPEPQTSGPTTADDAGGLGGSSSTGSSGYGGGTPAVGPAVHAPGITATSIYLGIPYSNDVSAGNAALGASGEQQSDQRAYYKAAIDDVNRRGGVLGRKLVADFYAFNLTDPPDQQSQAACDHWTKDGKVFMIFDRGPVAYECARKAGILVTGGGSATGPVYAKYPNLFDPAAIRLERLGAVTVNAMVRQHWQVPSETWKTGRIGLITWDDTNYKYAMQHGYLQALHEHGLKETDVRYVPVADTANSVGNASAAISNAVLRFSSEGIDHVLIADGPAGLFTGTGLTLLFLETAKSQRYYPRYGFNSYNSPGWENLPADQEHGMLAIDAFDVNPEDDQGTTPNQPMRRCLALMTQRGLAVGDETNRDLAAGACETAWFPEAILERTAGTTLSQLIEATESLGTSFRSPYLYGTRLSPRQHDGAALFRNSRFDDDCKCMKYSSKPYEP